MAHARAITCLLLLCTPVLGGDTGARESLILYVDADNPRVRVAIDKLDASLKRSGAASRHRTTIRHLSVDLWNASDIENRIGTAVAGMHPAVIVASNSQNAAIAKRVAGATPIVFVSHQDPIRLGLVLSLAHPGGTLTGLTYFAPIDRKRLELLRQIAPRARRLGILVDRWWMEEYDGGDILRDAHDFLGFDPQVFLAESIPDLQGMLGSHSARSMDAWYVPYTGLAFEQPLASVAAFDTLRKPVMFPATIFTESGGLASYQQTVTLDETLQVLGRTITLILDGVGAGEIPVERPKAFELAVNAAAAKRLGLEIPEQLLKRADRVITPGTAAAERR